MSNTINPRHYSKEDKKKMGKIPGTSWWIEDEEHDEKRKEKVAFYVEQIIEKAANMRE